MTMMDFEKQMSTEPIDVCNVNNVNGCIIASFLLVRISTASFLLVKIGLKIFENVKLHGMRKCFSLLSGEPTGLSGFGAKGLKCKI